MERKGSDLSLFSQDEQLKSLSAQQEGKVPNNSLKYDSRKNSDHFKKEWRKTSNQEKYEPEKRIKESSQTQEQTQEKPSL